MCGSTTIDGYAFCLGLKSLNCFDEAHPNLQNLVGSVALSMIPANQVRKEATVTAAMFGMTDDGYARMPAAPDRQIKDIMQDPGTASLVDVDLEPKSHPEDSDSDTSVSGISMSSVAPYTAPPSSQTSMESNLVATIASIRLFRAFCEDEDLAPLLPVAFQKVGYNRIERILSRLLQRLSKELKDEVATPTDHNAHNFFRHEMPTLRQRLIERFGKGKEVYQQLAQQKVEPIPLKRFLSDNDKEDVPWARDSKSEEVEVNSSEDDDDAGIPGYDAMRNFLVGGQPFRNFKTRLESVVHPPPDGPTAGNFTDAILEGSSTETKEGMQTSLPRASTIPDQENLDIDIADQSDNPPNPRALEAIQEIASDPTDNVAAETVQIPTVRTTDERCPQAPDIQYDIFFTRPITPTLLDLCKRLTEQIAGCPLSWWPLAEPEKELKTGYTRVYSKRFVRSFTYSQLNPANTDLESVVRVFMMIFHPPSRTNYFHDLRPVVLPHRSRNGGHSSERLSSLMTRL